MIGYHATNAKFNAFELKAGKRSIMNHMIDTMARGVFFKRTPEETFAYGEYILKCELDVHNTLCMRELNENSFVITNKIASVAMSLVEKKLQNNRTVWLFPFTYTDHDIFASMWNSDEKTLMHHDSDNKSEIESEEDIAYELENMLAATFRDRNISAPHWSWLDSAIFVNAMLKEGYDSTQCEESEDDVDSSIFVCDLSRIKILESLP